MIIDNTEIKAVIFDLDGTLIDTEKYYQDAWPKAMSHFGFNMTREISLRFRSLGRPYAPKLIKELFGPTADYDAIRAYRQGIVNELIRQNGIDAKPGAAKLLNYLRSCGITTAIATATSLDRVEQHLDLAGINGLYDVKFSAADVPCGKPAPDVYEHVCRALNLDPSECIAVEDAPNGILSAHSAGCHVIMVPDLTEPDEELSRLIYKKCGRLDEIIGLFNA